MGIKAGGKKRLINALLLLPFILGVFLTDRLEPEWLWRIFFVYLATLVFTSFFVRSLIHPELVFQEGVDISKKPKALKIFVYIGSVVAVVTLFIFAVIPISKDIYGIATNDHYLITEEVEILDIKYGSKGWIIGNSIIVTSKETKEEFKEYILIFSWPPKSGETHTIIRSPKTYFIWDVVD